MKTSNRIKVGVTSVQLAAAGGGVNPIILAQTNNIHHIH